MVVEIGEREFEGGDAALVEEAQAALFVGIWLWRVREFRRFLRAQAL
jgi:hypothetical protein